MKIMVVEDDLTSRTMLASVLRKWGYQVAAAETGEEAWDMLRAEEAFRLVILDWMMPGISGLDLCRGIRSEATVNPLYVIILTARRERGDIVAGLEAGADDYIAKPYDADELRARIQVGRRVIELQLALNERVRELESAVSHIRTLQGIIPICSYCHKIRTDKQGWERLETYISEHSEAEFTHGICPECMSRHHAELLPGG